MTDPLIMSPQEFNAALNGSRSERRLAHLHAALEGAGAQLIQQQQAMQAMVEDMQKMGQNLSNLRTIVAAFVERSGGSTELFVDRLNALNGTVKLEMEQDPLHLRIKLVPREPAPADA